MEAAFRCIFCKNDASSSRSIEHIIPESLGNRSKTLPPGIVCDSCNNYFARKIEEPLLSNRRIRHLRSRQLLENKRGRIPASDGVLPQLPCEVRFWWHGDQVSVDPVDHGLRATVFKELLAGRLSKLVIAPSEFPADKLIARFLAKVSVEFLATRLIHVPRWDEFLIDDPQLDPIRRFARRGDQPDHWPYSIRQIYDENAVHLHNDGEHQILNEFDFLVTPHGEYYGVLCVFGVEMAINLGGSEIDGYHGWLKENRNRSPLYLKVSDRKRS